jgi:multidrug efflux pump subunit AcrB
VQALIAEARKQPELSPQQIFSSFSTSTPQPSTTSTAARRSFGLSLPDVFSTLQIYLGSLYVNDFNLFGAPFRVTAGDKGARASAERHLASLRPQQLRRHGAAVDAWDADADRRSRDGSTLQRLCLRS